MGISTQTSLEQLEMAEANLLPPYQLSDRALLLADDLELPTREIDGRDEYVSLVLTIINGRIVRVFFPIGSPKGELSSIVDWVSQKLTSWHLTEQGAEHDATNG